MPVAKISNSNSPPKYGVPSGPAIRALMQSGRLAMFRMKMPAGKEVAIVLSSFAKVMVLRGFTEVGEFASAVKWKNTLDVDAGSSSYDNCAQARRYVSSSEEGICREIEGAVPD